MRNRSLAHFCSLKAPFSIIFFLAVIFINGCSEGPREEYTELCVDVAKTARQRQACACLAYEYGKVLTPDEYRTVNIMLSRSISDLRENRDNTNEPVAIDKTDINETVYMDAMKKIALLQRTGICGYTSENNQTPD